MQTININVGMPHSVRSTYYVHIISATSFFSQAIANFFFGLVLCQL